jgi:Tfp pilus assembly protein PilF
LGDAAQARDYLERTLTLNPHFSILYAEQARRTLDELYAAEGG